MDQPQQKQDRVTEWWECNAGNCKRFKQVTEKWNKTGFKNFTNRDLIKIKKVIMMNW